MIRPHPRPISVIFPEDMPMWRAAEAMLRAKVEKDRMAIGFALDRGGADLADAEIVVSFALAKEEAARAPRLRWIQSLGSGTDSLAAVAAASGAILTSAKGLHAAPVSEAVMTALLILARGVDAQIRHQDAARWAPGLARLLTGSRVGIVGSGEIAQATARKCAAFGMRVTGFSAVPRAVPCFDAVLPRSALLAEAGTLDHLILLAPLDDTTRHLAAAPLFTAMKDDAVLLNFGRGGLVDEPALIAALTSRQIRGAALDTFATEPLPPDHPFWRLPNVIVTAHAAGRHRGYVADVVALFLDNLARYDAGDIAGMRNRV